MLRSSRGGVAAPPMDLVLQPIRIQEEDRALGLLGLHMISILHRLHIR